MRFLLQTYEQDYKTFKNFNSLSFHNKKIICLFFGNDTYLLNIYQSKH